MTNTQAPSVVAPPSSTHGAGVTCPKCHSVYPAGCTHHCATVNLPSQVSPGQTCPRCGCWHNGVHTCGLVYLTPLPAMPPTELDALRGDVAALRAEVAALRAPVAELEKR